MKEIKPVTWIALLAVGILASLYFSSMRSANELRSQLEHAQESREQNEAFTKALYKLNEAGRLGYCLTYKNSSGEQSAGLTLAAIECQLSMTARSAARRIVDYTSRYGKPRGVDWNQTITTNLIPYLGPNDSDMAAKLESLLTQKQ